MTVIPPQIQSLIATILKINGREVTGCCDRVYEKSMADAASRLAIDHCTTSGDVARVEVRSHAGRAKHFEVTAIITTRTRLHEIKALRGKRK